MTPTTSARVNFLLCSTRLTINKMRHFPFETHKIDFVSNPSLDFPLRQKFRVTPYSREYETIERYNQERDQSELSPNF